MTTYRHFNGMEETLGTEEYFSQLAINNWQANINGVQARYKNCQAFVYAYLSRLTIVEEEIDPDMILTLADA